MQFRLPGTVEKFINWIQDGMDYVFYWLTQLETLYGFKYYHSMAGVMKVMEFFNDQTYCLLRSDVRVQLLLYSYIRVLS